MTVMRATTFSATMFLSCVLLAYSAMAEVVTLKSEMKGSNEIPPNTSTATGTVEATLDTASKQLTYTVTYSGLSGPVLGAHFHGPSEAGKNAGIVLPFKVVQSPITGTATLTDSQVADLLRGSGTQTFIPAPILAVSCAVK